MGTKSQQEWSFQLLSGGCLWVWLGGETPVGETHGKMTYSSWDDRSSWTKPRAVAEGRWAAGPVLGQGGPRVPSQPREEAPACPHP